MFWRAVKDGSVPDSRAGPLVEPWPLLGENFVEVGHRDEITEQLDEVRRVIILGDQCCLEWGA